MQISAYSLALPLFNTSGAVALTAALVSNVAVVINESSLSEIFHDVSAGEEVEPVAIKMDVMHMLSLPITEQYYRRPFVGPKYFVRPH